VPQWPNFRGVPHLVGTSPSGAVTVYVDPHLGTQGFQNASDLLADADRVVGLNNQIFGTPGGHTDVIVWALNGVTTGEGGADHADCSFGAGSAIEADASFGNSARVSGLFEAELSECSMGGNLCGVSTGEALSRWCAMVTSNNALPDFATAPTWADNGMPDFVNRTDPTDTDPVSTGAGMAFISWLLSSDIKLAPIAQGLVKLTATGTFADLFANLTGKPASDAEPLFSKAVTGLAGGVTGDDPFGGFSKAL
jgi:hypothetical protein